MSSTSPRFAGLDLLASAVLVLDANLRVRHVNGAGQNLLAVSERSLAGKRLAEVCPCSSTLQAALANAVANNWSYTGQNVEMQRADGEPLHLNCTVTPLLIEDPTGARLLLELQPIEQQLAASREER